MNCCFDPQGQRIDDQTDRALLGNIHHKAVPAPVTAMRLPTGRIGQVAVEVGVNIGATRHVHRAGAGFIDIVGPIKLDGNRSIEGAGDGDVGRGLRSRLRQRIASENVIVLTHEKNAAGNRTTFGDIDGVGALMINSSTPTPKAGSLPRAPVTLIVPPDAMISAITGLPGVPPLTVSTALGLMMVLV